MNELILIIIVAVFAHLSLSRQPKAKPRTKATRLLDKRLDNLWRLSRRQLNQGKFGQAEKALLTILKLDEKNAAAYNRIGLVYAHKQAYDRAVDCFEIASTIDQTPSSFNNLGSIYFEMEHYEKASLAFKKALELDNQSAVRYISYVKALERLGGHGQEILDYLIKAAKLEPNQEILSMLFEAYLKLDMPAEALRIQTKIKHLPKNRQKPIKRPQRTVAGLG